MDISFRTFKNAGRARNHVQSVIMPIILLSLATITHAESPFNRAKVLYAKGEHSAALDLVEQTYLHAKKNVLTPNCFELTDAGSSDEAQAAVTWLAQEWNQRPMQSAEPRRVFGAYDALADYAASHVPANNVTGTVALIGSYYVEMCKVAATWAEIENSCGRIRNDSIDVQPFAPDAKAKFDRAIAQMPPTKGLENAVRSNDITAARSAIARKADVNAVTESREKKSCMTTTEAAFFAKNPQVWSVPLLWIAAGHKNAGMMSLLLRAGANPNAKPGLLDLRVFGGGYVRGKSEEVLRQNRASLVELLLVHGYRPTVSDLWYFSPFSRDREIHIDPWERDSEYQDRLLNKLMSKASIDVREGYLAWTKVNGKCPALRGKYAGPMGTENEGPRRKTYVFRCDPDYRGSDALKSSVTCTRKKGEISCQ